MALQDRGLLVITGANGTIGYNSTLYALRQGYRVRCVVRRKEAVECLQSAPSLRPFADRIEYVIIENNEISGSYDAALAGAQYVIHVAGVWPTPDKHPDNDIWYPFVNSMKTVLSAAEKSQTVRRVVFTQAGAALVHPDDGDALGTAMNLVLDEHTSVDTRLLSLSPPISSPHHAYCAAKAYCMTYLKDLQASGKAPFSIVQVIPGTVMGPSELVSNAKEARARMDRMSRALLFNEPNPRYLFGFVQAEDCAKVHVECLDESKLPDSQIPDWIIAALSSKKSQSGQEVWQEAADVIQRTFHREISDGMFTIGRDKMPLNMPYYVNSSFTEKTLLDDGKFKSLNDCVKEVGHWYINLSATSL